MFGLEGQVVFPALQGTSWRNGPWSSAKSRVRKTRRPALWSPFSGVVLPEQPAAAASLEELSPAPPHGERGELLYGRTRHTHYQPHRKRILTILCLILVSPALLSVYK